MSLVLLLVRWLEAQHDTMEQMYSTVVIATHSSGRWNLLSSWATNLDLTFGFDLSPVLVSTQRGPIGLFLAR